MIVLVKKAGASIYPENVQLAKPDDPYVSFLFRGQAIQALTFFWTSAV
jgi:hypothetical protein